MKNYDVILIGTGQATGVMLPEWLNQKLSVAIIEEDRTGGTCVNWGCTPTKTLIASARVAHVVRTAGSFGVKVDGFSVDYDAVRTRVDKLRNATSQGLESWLKSSADFYHGHAEFTSPHEVIVGGEVLTGKTIYIHTGTRSFVPALRGLEEVPYLDNRSLLALEQVPEHLVILGGSYIALEFAQAFRRLGSRVTLVQRSQRLVTREDADFADALSAILEAEGVEVICGAETRSVAKKANSIVVDLEQGGKPVQVKGSHLLVALGRVPNSGLGLEKAGVAVDGHGFIVTDDQLRTNVPHIFAVGDVNGRGAFTHTSVHDGQVALNAAQGGTLRVTDRNPISALYVDPPFGRVGLSETDALKTGKKLLKATMPMASVSRAKEKGETAGFIKVLVDADTKLIVGAAILGVGGDEVINMLAVVMAAGLPYTKLHAVVLVHPTLAELIPWVFDSLKPLNF